MAGSRRMSLNAALKAAMKADTKEEMDVAIRRIEQRAYNHAANIAKIYAEIWQAEANSTTDDDRRLALLKAGHWRLIEKAIRELVYPPKNDRSDKLVLPCLKVEITGISCRKVISGC